MAYPDYANLGFKELIAELKDGVMTLTINREHKRNMFGGHLPYELIQAYDLCDKDDRVKVIVLTARPTAPAFCSGADISGGWNMLFSGTEAKEGIVAHRDGGGKVSLAIYNCRKITIAAVNGHAVGVGMTGLQLPCDIRIVWKGAKLAFPFVRRGIAAEATSSYILPRLLGHSRASALFLTGATVTPTSHLIDGLYYKILDTREEVYPAALELAKELAVHTAPVAVQYTKALLRHPGDSIEENHLLDSRGIALLGKSHDAEEGARSFMERREPKFTDNYVDPDWYPWWKTVDINHRKAKL